MKKQLKELKVVASWEWDRGMGKGLFYFAISLVALFFLNYVHYFDWNTHTLLTEHKMMSH